jgi:hypothetical protein
MIKRAHYKSLMILKKTGLGIFLLWSFAMGTVFAENTPQAVYEQYVQSVKRRNFD